MSARVRSAAAAFVREWSLHDGGLPVDLSVLHDHFAPVYLDLSSEGVLGTGVFLPGGNGDVTVGRIMIDEALSGFDRRLVYAHELGHFVAGHMASSVTSSLNSWQHDREERQAWIAAAVMLVPVEAFGWDETIDGIAESCGVPPELIALSRDGM